MTKPNGSDRYETGHVRLTHRHYDEKGPDVVKEAYDAWDDYDTDMVEGRGYTLPGDFANIVKKHVDPKPTDHILDAGAGSGLIGAAMVDAGFFKESLNAVDLSHGMLLKAARKEIYNTLKLGDLTKLPFKDASFDHVVSAGAIGIAPSESIDELARITKAGGKIIFTVRTVILDDPSSDFTDRMKRWEQLGAWKKIDEVGPIYADQTIKTEYMVFVFERL